MKNSLYTLKTVTLLTGINEHTLRAWELRYQAVRPQRSESGRRLYDQEQVDRIRTLMLLSERGHAIGSIAALSDNELARRLAETSNGNVGIRLISPEDQQDAVADLIASVKAFDLTNFRAILHQTMHREGGVDFILRTVSPFMFQVGALSTAGEITVAQEHAVSAIAKGTLFELFFSVPQAGNDKTAKRRKFVFATMEGDFHEMGILSAAVLAKIAGHEAVYIGPNTPPAAAAAAANSLLATDIMIGVVDIHASLLKYSAEQYFDALRPNLRKDISVGFGGSPRMLAELTLRQGVRVITSLGDFHKYLQS